MDETELKKKLLNYSYYNDNREDVVILNLDYIKSLFGCEYVGFNEQELYK